MHRLLVLGLDAGDLNYIRARAAKLPTLRNWLAQGQLTELSAPADLSGAVWSSFHYGREPGEHGLYQHLLWDAKTMGGLDWSRTFSFAQPPLTRLSEFAPFVGALAPHQNGAVSRPDAANSES